LHKQPLISFCIPTYNRAPFLAETLKSILAQAGPDIEIVISDNASTDGTEALVADFKKNYSAVQYARNESNLGYDRNLLRAIGLARGEYIWLFGSDDLLKEGAIEAVRQKILNAPVRPTLVYINHEILSRGRGILIPYKVTCRVDRDLDVTGCLRLLGLNLGYMSALVVPRDQFQRVEVSPAVLGSGWVQLYLLMGHLQAGGPIRYVGRPYVSVGMDPRPWSWYDYTETWVEHLDRVLWSARNWGYSRATIRRMVSHTIRHYHFRVILSWRCDNEETLRKAFPKFLKAYWRYPWFWILLVPARYAPRSVILAARNWVRRRRALADPNVIQMRPGISA